MSKKIKIQLLITIGITIILLLTSYFLIRAKAENYLSVLDEMAEKDWESEDVEYGGLGFIAAIIAVTGTTIHLFALPLLPTVVMLLPFFLTVLIAKKEKTLENATLVLMILSIISTIIKVLYIAGLTFLFVIFALKSPTPILSFVIVAMLSLTAISLIANTITTIVSYARLRKYCIKIEQEQGAFVQ